MVTHADIVRLLNFSDCDDSALAEVITDYFDDRESEADDDDFLDTGEVS